MANRDRQLAGRAGALRSWANTSDKTARTQAGRSAFLSKFEREVDPGGILPEKERKERALYLRRAYMTELALKSAQVRRDKAQKRKGQSDVQPGEDDDGCAVISIHHRPFAGPRADAGQQAPAEADLAEQTRKLG